MSNSRICPDCGGLIYWNSHFKAFIHDNSSNCSYMEDIDGKRIYDTTAREERLDKLQQRRAKIRLLTGHILEEELEEDAFLI